MGQFFLTLGRTSSLHSYELILESKNIYYQSSGPLLTLKNITKNRKPEVGMGVPYNKPQ